MAREEGWPGFHAFLVLAAFVVAPDEEYRILARRYEESYEAFVTANREVKTKADQDAVDAHPGRNPRGFAGGFMRLARDHPGSKSAENALIWVASHVLYGSETEEAKRLLARDHIASAKLDRVFGSQWATPGSVATGLFLRRAFAESPHRAVRGLAGYWLARFLKEQAKWSRGARRNPDAPTTGHSVVEEGWGADYLARLRRLDPDALDEEAELLFSRVAKVYGDVPIKEKASVHQTLGAAARAYLREYRELSDGRPAPEIEGEDLDGVQFKLSDYRGKVVVLDFGSHFY
jgi:hypothetical protein